MNLARLTELAETFGTVVLQAEAMIGSARLARYGEIWLSLGASPPPPPAARTEARAPAPEPSGEPT